MAQKYAIVIAAIAEMLAIMFVKKTGAFPEHHVVKNAFVQN